MQRDPHNPYGEKSIGLAAMGSMFFCTTTGLGVGAFVQQWAIGAVIGLIAGLIGILIIVPPLMRDLRD